MHKKTTILKTKTYNSNHDSTPILFPIFNTATLVSLMQKKTTWATPLYWSNYKTTNTNQQPASSFFQKKTIKMKTWTENLLKDHLNCKGTSLMFHFLDRALFRIQTQTNATS